MHAFRYYFSPNFYGNFVIVISCHFVDEAAEAQRGSCPRSHRCSRSWGQRPFCQSRTLQPATDVPTCPLCLLHSQFCLFHVSHEGAAASAPLRAMSFIDHILEFSVGVCVKEQELTVSSDQRVESIPPGNGPLGHFTTDIPFFFDHITLAKTIIFPLLTFPGFPGS